MFFTTPCLHSPNVSGRQPALLVDRLVGRLSEGA